PVMNPITPLEAGAEVFQKGRIQPFLAVPHNLARPLSQATEFVDTDFDDDDESLFEEDSPKGSFGSVSTAPPPSSPSRLRDFPV
ncbi:hypothetical protein LTR28_001010, partial [Elasticomyces elasticus]